MIPFKDNITLVNDQLAHEVCKSVKQGTVLCAYSSISVPMPQRLMLSEWYCINKLEE